MGSLCQPKGRPALHEKANLAFQIGPHWHRRRPRPCATWVVYATPGRPNAFNVLQDAPQVTRTSLLDPAEIGGSCRTTVPVQDAGGDVSLDRYMRLPVEQYSELDPTIISPLEGKSFALRVPRIHILNVWLEPVVEVHAELLNEQNQVLISSTRCQIRGSELVEKLQLNKRFCMSFTNKLTWTSASAPRSLNAASPPSASSNGTPAAALGPKQPSPVMASGTQIAPPPRGIMDRLAHPFGRSDDASRGAIHGDSKLEVWVEILGPFRIFPREFLQGTANAVLAGLMRTLLPIFTRKLAADYRKWATDAEYRERRAALSRGQISAPPTAS